MESFKPKPETKKEESMLATYLSEAGILTLISSLAATGIIFNGVSNMNKAIENAKARHEKGDIPAVRYFEQPADLEITKSVILLGNSMQTDILHVNLQDYARIINSPERLNTPLTNGEYFAIHARAVELAQKKGIVIGDVLEITPDNTAFGPKVIKYIGTIDIGDHVTQKVVPPVFYKTYAKVSDDHKTIDVLEGNIQEIRIEDNDDLLLPTEKVIRGNNN